MEPKIFSFDIETAPSLGWYFDRWKEGNIVGDKSDWYILCYAAKQLGGSMVTHALPDFKGYKPGSEDDEKLVKELWKLFDEADILIAHNGDRFDIRKVNARFAYYKLPPPSPYKTIDTLKVARKYFNFTSNKLDDLGNHLGYGRKLAHTGFHLWKGCMTGDPKSWKHMIDYNKRDVILLEQVYLHLRPWLTTHPPVSPDGCINCGHKNFGARREYMTRKGQCVRFQCNGCGSWTPLQLNKTINAKRNKRISKERTKPHVDRK